MFKIVFSVVTLLFLFACSKATESSTKTVIDLSTPQAFMWTNPVYKPCKDAANPKAHPHMTFVPDGLTLFDGTETPITKYPENIDDPRFNGKDIQAITLPQRQVRFDPNKKTVIFVLGYDLTGRSYDFFESPNKSWQKEFNTFIFRWSCEAFNEDIAADDVFEATENARKNLVPSLRLLKEKMGLFYDKEIRFVSISMGGPLVLEALSDVDFSSHFLGISDTKPGDEPKYLRRADFLDPALFFEFLSPVSVTDARGFRVPPERFNETARQVSNLINRGFATMAYSSAYGQLMTTSMYRWMSVQRMDDNWLYQDYANLQNGIPVPGMIQFDTRASQWNLQHIAMVPAYFNSLDGERVSADAVNIRTGINARTPTSWILHNRVFLKQDGGIGTLNFSDDTFKAVENPCPRGIFIDQNTTFNPAMPQSIVYGWTRCF